MSKVRFMYLHAEDGKLTMRSGMQNPPCVGCDLVTVALGPKGHKCYTVLHEGEGHNRKDARDHAFKRLADAALSGQPRTKFARPGDFGMECFCNRAGFRDTEHFETKLSKFIADHPPRKPDVVKTK